MFAGQGKPFELRNFAIPDLASGEILIDVTCSTICGSDVHTWKGRREEPTPCILGHEITGRIAAFGENARRLDLRGHKLNLGDRVTWTLAASCGECFFCRNDLSQKCTELFKYGHAAIRPGKVFSGGFAECCVLSEGTGVIKVPDEISDPIAAMANCAVATVAAAFRRAGSVDGSVVAVIGCGVLGLFACAMARNLGAAEVIGCDVSPERETMARQFGAGHFCLPEQLSPVAKELTCGRGADVAIELSGASDAVTTGIDALRTGGTQVIAGTTTAGHPILLDPNIMIRRMLTITGLHNYAPMDLVAAMDFLTETHARFPYTSIGGGTFALDQIEEAFDSAAAQPGRRIAITSSTNFNSNH